MKNKLQRIGLWTLCLCLTLVLASCQKEELPSPPEPQTEEAMTKAMGTCSTCNIWNQLNSDGKCLKCAYSPTETCNICRKKCQAKNERMRHCNVCSQYKDSSHDCQRCNTCGSRDDCNCDNPNPGGPIGASPSAAITTALRGKITSVQLNAVIVGQNFYNQSPYLSHSNLYRHGIYQLSDMSTARAKTRNSFVSDAREFLKDKNRRIYYFGMALHPILTAYIPLPIFAKTLDLHPYPNSGSGSIDQVVGCGAATTADETVGHVWNELKKLNSSATDTQIGAVYDLWAAAASDGWNNIL